MKYRRLGRTNLRVSEIGFGGWGIGKTSWIGAEDETSIKALRTARNAGVNFLDTAAVYGRGHSERLLGQMFGDSNEVVFASKVPPKNRLWPAPAGVPLREAYPRAHVLQCLQGTLRNLCRECVDLYQFHVWSDEWASDDEWLATVDEIKRSGMARFVGISINDHQPENVLKALETGLVDCVQVIYNLFDQSPKDRLLPYCRAHDIGVISRVPFDEGSLTGKVRPGVTFPSGDFRNYYFGGNRKHQVWKRVQRLVDDAGIRLDELPNLALRFSLSHEAVSTVIPGMRTTTHVLNNVTASDSGLLTQSVLDRLHKHRWVRNFYSPPQPLIRRIGSYLLNRTTGRLGFSRLLPTRQ